jgi:hypothetical protein
MILGLSWLVNIARTREKGNILFTDKLLGFGRVLEG